MCRGVGWGGARLLLCSDWWSCLFEVPSGRACDLSWLENKTPRNDHDMSIKYQPQKDKNKFRLDEKIPPSDYDRIPSSQGDPRSICMLDRTNP